MSSFGPQLLPCQEVTRGEAHRGRGSPAPSRRCRASTRPRPPRHVRPRLLPSPAAARLGVRRHPHRRGRPTGTAERDPPPSRPARPAPMETGKASHRPRQRAAPSCRLRPTKPAKPGNKAASPALPAGHEPGPRGADPQDARPLPRGPRTSPSSVHLPASTSGQDGREQTIFESRVAGGGALGAHRLAGGARRRGTATSNQTPSRSSKNIPRRSCRAAGRAPTPPRIRSGVRRPSPNYENHATRWWRGCADGFTVEKAAPSPSSSNR